MSKKVIVAGHICLDITPVFPDKKVHAVSDMLLPGKLIQMKEADVHTGGCVANTGLGMKILGGDVQLMGKVGNDAFGDMVLNFLEKYNCTAEMIRSYNESTSYSVVLAMPGIDRIFLHNPGTNDTFRAEDIPVEKLKEIALGTKRPPYVRWVLPVSTVLLTSQTVQSPRVDPQERCDVRLL
jgi:sugar/nucleoside kinase (ribokinase family)